MNKKGQKKEENQLTIGDFLEIGTKQKLFAAVGMAVVWGEYNVNGSN